MLLMRAHLWLSSTGCDFLFFFIEKKKKKFATQQFLRRHVEIQVDKNSVQI